MSVYTEFWKLKKIIVWNVQKYNLDTLDRTFKIAYEENLKLSNFDEYSDYKIDKQKIIERTEDLDHLAQLLEELWVEVYRPNELKEFITFKTLFSRWVLNSVANPRDICLIHGKYIIETPSVWTKRFFEGQLLYDVFFDLFDRLKYIWISVPKPLLSQDKIDKEYWKIKRDFKNFDRKKYDIAFDAANILKIGKDLIFNISTYNHELWADWLQRFLWDDYSVHKVYNLDDNHIDGKLNVLSPWVFLSYDSSTEDFLREQLPEKFRDWKILFTEWMDREIIDNTASTYMQLTSVRGSWTNVLSIDENTVLCLDTATETIALLEQNNYTVIPVQLRHCELFGWWLHCATLDIEREDACMDYTL